MGQKTIKEAANRLKINYSTAKHIIKSQKNEVPANKKASSDETQNQGYDLPMKHAASVDIETLEQKIKTLKESTTTTPSIFSSRLG